MLFSIQYCILGQNWILCKSVCESGHLRHNNFRQADIIPSERNRQAMLVDPPSVSDLLHAKKTQIN